MPADAGNPRLDALNSVLVSAQQLIEALESDPLIGRMLAALAGLPPDDRQTLVTAIERGVAWRRVNESVSDVVGVRLRVNPNARLFVRVIDREAPKAPLPPEPEDVLISILRALRRAPIVAADAARAIWEPAAAAALEMLSPEERRACVRVVRTFLALLERIVGDDDPGSGTSSEV
jgi:hypothetical protein